MKARYDAVVVGSGPNGLAAAITIAERGGSVIVLEGSPEPGGGARSAELTLPGFMHDVCSAAHPLAISSPFLKNLPLDRHGLEWILSPCALAHPLDDGTAVLLHRSLESTSAGLDPKDAETYRKLLTPYLSHGDNFFEDVMRAGSRLPRHPFLLSRFGLNALLPAKRLAESSFHGVRAQALFGGISAHSSIPLSRPLTSGVGLMLTLAAHLRGWPIPRGGARAITQALISYFTSLGGEVQTGIWIRSLKNLPSSRWIFLDVTPTQLAEIAASRLSESQRKRLTGFRHAMGVYKMDFALVEPIPWKARECQSAATVHLGGSQSEIASSELETQNGIASARPFVLLVQPTLFDPTRAPPGKHIAWAYCHVPNGSSQDMSQAIETQIERFAPGFSQIILARSTRGPLDLERTNPNLIGGDISGGALNLKQMFLRPRLGLSPYSTPIPNVFLCSSSTPPGPGVHGMCGHLAALHALGLAG